MAKNRCIGRDGRLPWQLPGDLQRFKQLTTGHGLLMGRKTFESIGRPLPGRTSYVLSRSPDFIAERCVVFGDLSAAITAAETAGETELFVCGGEEIYRQTLPLSDRIYLTELAHEVEGDRFFPEIPADQFNCTRHLLICGEESWKFSILHRKQTFQNCPVERC